MRLTKVIGCLLAAAPLGGCITENDYLALAEPHPVKIAALTPAPKPSSIPWQLTPASTASIAQGETTIIVPNDKYGKVKGTPVAVANLEKPVVAFAHRGEVVTACRKVIEPQAKSIGAYSVQAAAAGPEKRVDGQRVQQIFFRIVYDRPEYLEVRQAALVCTIDARNQVVEAKPV